MSEGNTNNNYSGIGLLGVMLVLGYGPLNWSFPHWMWWLALGLPIFLIVFSLAILAIVAIIKR
jgi:hypothetical protein